MSVKNQIANPVGIDVYIKKLQNYLYNNLWTSATYDSYPRCQMIDGIANCHITDDNTAGNDYEKINTHNDEFADALSFFVVEESTEIDINLFIADVEIYFYVNLSKCYPTAKHRADENAHQDAYMLLVGQPYGFDVESIEYGEDVDRVKKEEMQPFHIFRITGQMEYQYKKTNC